MAYNFCAVQRISDGKYLLANNTFGTLDFTSNFTTARFYFSDADDVQNYLGSHPGGDYRVIEYWMPGDTGRNLPKSNSTILNNIQGSLYSANSVTADTVFFNGSYDRVVVTDATQFTDFASDYNNNGGGGYLLFTQTQVDTYGLQGAEPARAVGLDAAYDGLFAVIIRAVNQSTRSGGYRRIAFEGAFFEQSFTGESIQFAFN